MHVLELDGRRLVPVTAPHHHRHRADLALRDPADVVLVEPLRDPRRLAEIARRRRTRTPSLTRWCSRRALGGARTRTPGPPRDRRRRRRRPTSALPTITPSAAPAASTACSGVEMPTPSSTGLSVTALQRAPISAACARQLRPLAGDAHQRHAVDEAARPLADRARAGRRGWWARRAARSRRRRRRRRRPSRRARRAGGRARSPRRCRRRRARPRTAR